LTFNPQRHCVAGPRHWVRDVAHGSGLDSNMKQQSCLFNRILVAPVISTAETRNYFKRIVFRPATSNAGYLDLMNDGIFILLSFPIHCEIAR
jgi:hypothetical protein